MEPSREELEGIMQRNGLDETEAKAGYHLREAHRLFKELYKPESESPGSQFANDVYNEMYFGTHFSALNGMLAMRAARRDHPEGWGQAPSEN